MDTTLPLRDVMRREFVGVGPGDTVAETAGLLASEGAQWAIVLSGGAPRGLITPTVLYESLSGEAASETRVESVMDGDPLVMQPDATVGEAAAVLSDAAAAIIVEADQEAVGLVTPVDLLGALTARPTAETTDPGMNPNAAREQPADDDDFARQSVCEACGTLTADLAEFNGQLVCPNCRSV